MAPSLSNIVLDGDRSPRQEGPLMDNEETLYLFYPSSECPSPCVTLGDGNDRTFFFLSAKALGDALNIPIPPGITCNQPQEDINGRISFIQPNSSPDVDDAFANEADIAALIHGVDNASSGCCPSEPGPRSLARMAAAVVAAATRQQDSEQQQDQAVLSTSLLSAFTALSPLEASRATSISASAPRRAGSSRRPPAVQPASERSKRISPDLPSECIAAPKRLCSFPAVDQRPMGVGRQGPRLVVANVPLLPGPPPSSKPTLPARATDKRQIKPTARYEAWATEMREASRGGQRGTTPAAARQQPARPASSRSACNNRNSRSENREPRAQQQRRRNYNRRSTATIRNNGMAAAAVA